MNWQEYISSGILESFVLGELSAKEAEQVMEMVSQYPEVQAELALIEQQMEAMAMSNAKIPTLRFEDIATKLSQTESQGDSEKPEVEGETKLRLVATEKRLRTAQLMSMAAGIAALIFGGLALNYFSKYQNISGDLLALQTEQSQYANELNMVKQKTDQLNLQLDLFRDDDFQQIKLAGTDNAPEALVYAFWNKSSSDLYLSIDRLQTLAQDRQFQLWSIIDGQPVDQGVFDGTEDGLIQLKDASGSVGAFAITIEPRGGSASPTLASMQVYGEPS